MSELWRVEVLHLGVWYRVAQFPRASVAHANKRTRIDAGGPEWWDRVRVVRVAEEEQASEQTS